MEVMALHHWGGAFFWVRVLQLLLDSQSSREQRSLVLVAQADALSPQ